MLVNIRSKAMFMLDAHLFERDYGDVKSCTVGADAEDLGCWLRRFGLGDGALWSGVVGAGSCEPHLIDLSKIFVIQENFLRH